MTVDALAHINDEMIAMGIPYAFITWRGAVEYPYFVGEYQESPAMLEDGMIESTFIITGTTNDSMMALETAKSIIEQRYRFGRSGILPNGHGIAVFYDMAFPIITGTAEYHRLQINLQVKEWRI